MGNSTGYGKAQIDQLLASINNAIGQRYAKPSNGIPKSDLASSVQTSLGAADAAAPALNDRGAWAASTAYAKSDVVTNPSGIRVVTKTAHTSTTSYDASKFVTLGAGATPAGSAQYDAATQRYNFNAGNLRPARVGEARALAGLGLCHIMTLGTSLTAGAGATRETSWPAYLRNQLAARGYPIAGTGWVVPGSDPGDARISFTGGGKPFTASFSALGTNDGNSGATCSFASDLPGTIAELAYLDLTGPFTFDVDNGAASMTVTPGNTGTLKKIALTGLTDGLHTARVTWTSTNQGFAAAFNVRRAAGLMISNFGYSGFATPASGGQAYSLFNVAQFLAPDVAYVEYGTNDPGSNQTNLTYVVNALRASAGVFLLSEPPRATFPTGIAGLGSDQNTNIYAVADALNVPLIDWGDRFGVPGAAVLGQSAQIAAYNSLPSTWLPGDGTHFTAPAYQDVATMVRVARGL